MSKALKRLSLVLLAASFCAPWVAAQATNTQSTSPAGQTPALAPPEWVKVSLAGEGFTARMPEQPLSLEQRIQATELNASGLRHTAAADDATTFIVWSMRGSHLSGPLGRGDRAAKFPTGVAPYLDGVAELAWELLVTPEFERLEREGLTEKRVSKIGLGMVYRRGFELSGLPAREYSVTLENERGHVYVCSEGTRVYVVAALGTDAGDARLRQFLESFALKNTPAHIKEGGGDAVPRTGSGIGSGSGVNTGGAAAAVDYTRPFKQSEVTRKALLTFKPEPSYTEQARKFNVTGVVRLRAVLHTSGVMQSIAVVKGLPHGLTEKSIAAARQIRFEPAQKDGRAVSQYVVLEYNYNIY